MTDPIAKARSRTWNVPTAAIRQAPLPSLLVGTFFFCGLSPFASGTVASAVAALLYYALPFLQDAPILLAASFACCIAGVAASNAIMSAIGEKDPGIIVIDEVVGQWLALVSLWYAGDIVFIVSAFVLFRAFDVLKIYPASYFEKKHGGWGVMLDDVVAGIYASIGAHLITYTYHHYL